jgi:group II intron reverse transcriptase/maturase
MENQYTKSTKNLMFYNPDFLGDNVSKNSRIPTRSNSYGIRVSVLARNFGSEVGQLKFFKKEELTTKSGFELLKDIADGKLNPLKNVYRIIYDSEVLKTSYNKLKLNITSSSTILTLDEIANKNLNNLKLNEKYFSNLVNKLKTETYQPKPTKKVLITTDNNKTHLLEIYVTEDKIVQQALLFLLEAIFEKTFSDKSHGFRTKKNTHTLCKNIRKWKKISWFIKGDIVNYFDTINHKKLIEIINQKIKDQQIIDLLWKFLRAGIIINKKFQRTTIGIQQSSIISPILSNIYLNCFDNFINELKKKFNTKQTNEQNLKYIKTKFLLRLTKNNKKKNNYNKKLQDINSIININLKLYYIRYVDNWLIGIWGSKKEAIIICKKIKIFLKKNLNLELSLEKTKITNANKQKTQFLGYEIYSPTPKEYFPIKSKVKKKEDQINTIYIDAPYNIIKERLINENILTVVNNKWLINAITHWINYNHADILYRYNLIIKSYLNYYSHVNNLHIFHKFIKFVLRHSCALTLGRKLKLKSRKKVFKKFSENLKDPKSQLTLAIPTNFISNTKNYKITTEINIDPLKIIKWSLQTQNLMHEPCSNI